MDISLSPDLQQYAENQVRTGRFHTLGEAIDEGLRLLKERDDLMALRQDELRRAVAVGLDEIECGEAEPLDFDEIRTEGRRLLAAKRAQK